MEAIWNQAVNGIIAIALVPLAVGATGICLRGTRNYYVMLQMSPTEGEDRVLTFFTFLFMMGLSIVAALVTLLLFDRMLTAINPSR